MAFLDTLSIGCDAFEDFAMASRALELSRSPAFDSTLPALRLIASLQPDPCKGTNVKRPLLKRLGMRPGPDNVQRFLGLRNLDLAPFPDNSTFLEDLALRFQEFLEANKGADNLATVAQSAFDPSQSTKAWRDAFLAGLANVSCACAGTLASQIRWILSDLPGRRTVSAQARQHRAFDGPRAGANPRRPGAHGRPSALRHLDPFGTRHRRDPSPDQPPPRRPRGRPERCLRAGTGADTETPRSSTSSRLWHPTSRLPPLSSFRTNSSSRPPHPRSRPRPRSWIAYPSAPPRLQEIWAEALDLDHDAWRVSRDAGALQRRVFECLLDGGLSSALLNRLVRTPLGNLLDYPRRVRGLARASSQLQGDLPARDSASLGRVRSPIAPPAHNISSPNPELAAAIASSSILPNLALSLQSLEFAQLLHVFAGNPELPDTLFEQPVHAACSSVTRLTAEEAGRAGRLVAARGWRGLTRRIWERHRGNEELRRFFEVCADHLDSWDRFRYGFHPPSRDDLYRLLVRDRLRALSIRSHGDRGMGPRRQRSLPPRCVRPREGPMGSRCTQDPLRRPHARRRPHRHHA